MPPQPVVIVPVVTHPVLFEFAPFLMGMGHVPASSRWPLLGLWEGPLGGPHQQKVWFPWRDLHDK